MYVENETTCRKSDLGFDVINYMPKKETKKTLKIPNTKFNYWVGSDLQVVRGDIICTSATCWSKTSKVGKSKYFGRLKRKVILGFLIKSVNLPIVFEGGSIKIFNLLI